MNIMIPKMTWRRAVKQITTPEGTRAYEARPVSSL